MSMSASGLSESIFNQGKEMNELTVLITGANRGIGFEFAQQYANDGWRVMACCRRPQAALTLLQLAKNRKNLAVHALDVSDFEQIDELAMSLESESIDLLINNSGVFSSDRFGEINFDQFSIDFKVNSLAPLKIAESFIQNISRSRLKKIATVSSKMGSTSGGSYSYRATKSATNMAMRSLSIDLHSRGISVVTLHPGWVQTDMGGSSAAITTQTSVAGMRSVIEQLSLTNTGRFLAYDNKEIAW
jgi:NAD(P)-dependent dehydrogenase (short-subunit alcohol dehydrogenase family)